MSPNSHQKIELFDCHVHPDYSLDATGTIDEYCQKALQIGLKGICFTSHYDIDPERKDIDAFMRVKGRITPLSQETVKIYREEIEEAKSRYAPSGLKVEAGLEIDYSPHIEKQLREDLSGLKLDYVLGAVHCLEHIAITSSEEAYYYFERKSAEQLCEDYYRSLISGIRSGLFDAVAHLDCFKKYALDYYGEKLLEAERKWIEPVLQGVINNRVGIELNTGWFRKGKKRFFPDVDILKVANEAGIKIVALGSDSHRVEDLSLGLSEAVDCIEKNKLKFKPFLT
jgi:histidinol-phosphatase (PHP family)